MACALFVASSCGGDSSDDSESLPAPSEEDVVNYGYGPDPDADVAYQPDVVVIEDGAAAIEAASADGLTWTIDAGARGASDLELESVMLASSTAVGRVVELRDEGDSRIVTLAPVELTEVIRDGTFDLDHNLDLSTVNFQEVPEYPGVMSDPLPEDVSALPPIEGASHGDDGEVITLPPLRLAASGLAQAVQLPPSLKRSVEVPIGDWTVKPYGEATKLGLNIGRKVGSSLKVGVDFAFTVDNFHISSAVTIKDGHVTSSGFVVEGIKGLQVTLQAGVANGSLDNSQVKIEVPVEINAPIPPSPATAGLPVNIKVTYKFAISTALTGDNATLFASGKYKLDGPIGVSGGTFHEPTFTVEQSIIDSIGGISLGPSGIVVAVSMKMLAGIGTPAATVGPFGSFTASLGLTNGSSLGAPLARCRSATLDLKVGGGVGLSVSPAVFEALKALLPAKTKIDNSIEVSKNILHRAQVVPDVPLCNA